MSLFNVLLSLSIKISEHDSNSVSSLHMPLHMSSEEQILIDAELCPCSELILLGHGDSKSHSS